MIVKMFLDSLQKWMFHNIKMGEKNSGKEKREKIQNNYESGGQTKQVAWPTDYWFWVVSMESLHLLAQTSM